MPNKPTTEPTCPLCLHTPSINDSALLFTADLWRVVDAQDPDFPGTTRVIWHEHTKEMSDLSTAGQQELMAIVLAVETVMRQTLSPDKVNLASLGNQVPHLHWHVIPRWQDDMSFPHSVWTPPSQTTTGNAASLDRRCVIKSRLTEYHQRLINRLASL